jgi:acetyltransferase-like isoleucine patch superfamily enzyme
MTRTDTGAVGVGAVERGVLEPLALDYAPWDFAASASVSVRADNVARIAGLRERGYEIGEGCMVSRFAAVHPERLRLGDRSYVAAHAHVTGDVEVGADCSLNVGVALRGRVRLGRAVRVGAGTSVLGFDHGFERTDLEIHEQPHTSEGVEIGDDVWLGAHVVVLDGVRVGPHAIVGAGAVVTKDVPAWAVAVGNPARVVRSRAPGSAPGTSPGSGSGSGEGALGALGEAARRDLPGMLTAAWDDDARVAGEQGAYRDAGGSPTVRAHTDAVELADLLLGTVPPQLTADEHARRLRALQDPATGAVDEHGDGPSGEGTRAYHVLAVGYALDLLGTSFAHPLALASVEAARVPGLLRDLPWHDDAWGAGASIDALGTALTWERRSGRPVPSGLAEALIGWLTLHLDPGTGLWGPPSDLLHAVNGTYRLVRGTFAQWGLTVPYPEARIDAVLRRAAQLDLRAAGADDTTMCDLLDVAHLLRGAAADRPGHRAADVRAAASGVVGRLAAAWVPGSGLAFRVGDAPSLKATELGLAAAWNAADLLGRADALGFRPRGVHRPGPALTPAELADAGTVLRC